MSKKLIERQNCAYKESVKVPCVLTEKKVAEFACHPKLAPSNMLKSRETQVLVKRQHLSIQG